MEGTITLKSTKTATEPPARNPKPRAPAHWLPYFAVADCEESCDTIQRLGGSLAMPIRAMDVEDVSIKMAVAQDPQGAMFGLVETLA